MICYILISTFGPSIAQVLSILTQLFILVWKLVAFYPAGGYIHLSNIQCRNRIYDHSDDWVLLCRFNILVYCVQSAGRPLRRINRHFVTVLSVIPSYTWTEWCQSEQPTSSIILHSTVYSSLLISHPFPTQGLWCWYRHIDNKEWWMWPVHPTVWILQLLSTTSSTGMAQTKQTAHTGAPLQLSALGTTFKLRFPPLCWHPTHDQKCLGNNKCCFGPPPFTLHFTLTYIKMTWTKQTAHKSTGGKHQLSSSFWLSCLPWFTFQEKGPVNNLLQPHHWYLLTVVFPCC